MACKRSGVRIPVAPLTRIAGQSRFRSPDRPFPDSAWHRSTATLAIELPAQPLQCASNLDCRDVAVDLHCHGGLAVPKASRNVAPATGYDFKPADVSDED